MKIDLNPSDRDEIIKSLREKATKKPRSAKGSSQSDKLMRTSSTGSGKGEMISTQDSFEDEEEDEDGLQASHSMSMSRDYQDLNTSGMSLSSHLTDLYIEARKENIHPIVALPSSSNTTKMHKVLTAEDVLQDVLQTVLQPHNQQFQQNPQQSYQQTGNSQSQQQGV